MTGRATVAKSGSRAKLSPQETVYIIRKNPGTIEAQTCHDLEL